MKLIRLTTTLAHSSGEWMSSDWPVCPVSEIAAPHRMGAALTYARRYALFTLVGIAGEDDLDAPDINGGSDGPPLSVASGEPGVHAGQDAPPPTGTSYPGPHKPSRSPRVILAPENSMALREQLIRELGAFTDTDALTLWAGRILPQKNQLATSDAQALESAFMVKLGELAGDQP